MKDWLRRQTRNLEPPLDSIGLRAGWKERRNNLKHEWICSPPSKHPHTYILGKPGFGKSVFELCEVDRTIRRQDSLILIDPQGDASPKILELLPGRVRPENTLWIDACDSFVGFNPLSKTLGEPRHCAIAVLDCIEGKFGALGPQTGEYLLHGLTMLAIHDRPLLDIERLFTDARFRRTLVSNTSEERLKRFWLDFDTLSAERQRTMASPVINKFARIFATSSLRRLFGHPCPVDIGRHISKKGSVTLVSLHLHLLGSSGLLLGSLFLSHVVNHLFSLQLRHRTAIIVDEFENFAFPQFETVLCEGRRYGMFLTIAHQNFAQLSPRLRQVILGSVGSTLTFQCSREDGLAMSKYLTGDPKELDFSSLPIGHAYFGRSGNEPVLVELNQSPIRETASLSQSAQNYLAQLRALVPPITSDERIYESYKKPPPQVDLKEWL